MQTTSLSAGAGVQLKKKKKEYYSLTPQQGKGLPRLAVQTLGVGARS